MYLAVAAAATLATADRDAKLHVGGLEVSALEETKLQTRHALHGGPPLPIKPPGFYITEAGEGKAVVELFLDYICPFSTMMLQTLTATPQGKTIFDEFAVNYTFILHGVPQPWHPQGAWIHEVALAVRESQPENHLKFVLGVMSEYNLTGHMGKFLDDGTRNQNRLQVYESLLEKLTEVGGDPEPVKPLIALKAGHNGNDITQQLKWAVKYHRLNAVHVTPTVFVNGLQTNLVGSRSTREQWVDYLTNGPKNRFSHVVDSEQ